MCYPYVDIKSHVANYWCTQNGIRPTKYPTKVPTPPTKAPTRFPTGEPTPPPTPGCSMFKTCESCIGSSYGCGFCDSGGSCTKGTSDGPNAGECGSTWSWRTCPFNDDDAKAQIWLKPKQPKPSSAYPTSSPTTPSPPTAAPTMQPTSPTAVLSIAPTTSPSVFPTINVYRFSLAPTNEPTRLSTPVTPSLAPTIGVRAHAVHFGRHTATPSLPAPDMTAEQRAMFHSSMHSSPATHKHKHKHRHYHTHRHRKGDISMKGTNKRPGRKKKSKLKYEIP